MNRFKFEDRVRITDIGRQQFPDNNFGKGVGDIIGARPGYEFSYEVRWDGGEDNTYRDCDLDFENLVLENI